MGTRSTRVTFNLFHFPYFLPLHLVLSSLESFLPRQQLTLSVHSFKVTLTREPGGGESWFGQETGRKSKAAGGVFGGHSRTHAFGKTGQQLLLQDVLTDLSRVHLSPHAKEREEQGKGR